MKCVKCGSKNVKLIRMREPLRVEIAHFVTAHRRSEPCEKLKCESCGHIFDT